MNQGEILQIVQMWSVTVATGTLTVLVYTYFKYKVRALRIWAVSWMFFILMQMSFYSGNKDAVAVFYSFFSGALLYGVLVHLREHVDIKSSIKPEIIGIIPPLFALYGIFLKYLGIPKEFLLNEALYVVLSGIFFLFSGLVFLAMRKSWKKGAFYLGIFVTLFGLFVVAYPLRVWTGGQVVWISIGSLLSVGIAFFMIQFATSKEFLFLEREVGVRVSLEPGANLIDLNEYPILKEELKDFPVLVFSRTLNLPESWKVYFLTSEERKNAIYPTNLPYMVQLASEYFREAKTRGLRGVVVVDCPEYLVMYNGFDSIAKFLASLKDFAITNEGVLLVVIDEGAWTPRQLVILKRLLE